MKWSMIRGWLIALAVIGGGVAALQYFLMRPQPVDVRIHRVKKGLVEETVSSTKAGAVRSRKVADISVDTPGTILKIHAREGKTVKKGDPLISIDRRDPDAALAVAQKELASAEAMLVETKARWEDAVRERDRLKELRKTESISQSQLDQAETQVKVTAAAHAAGESRVELQKAGVSRAKIAVDKSDIFAPFDGVVAQLLVEEGEWATPGKMALKLLDPDKLYIRAELDEVDIGSVKEEMPVRVSLDPYKGQKFTGTIKRISPYVSEVQEQNRTVVIEVELDASLDGIKLKHGISADVEVILRKEPDVLRIPTLALLEGNRVLVVGPDQKAVAVPVKIGLKNWEYAQIKEGLSGGESLIVSLESEKVKAGVQVKIVQEAER